MYGLLATSIATAVKLQEERAMVSMLKAVSKWAALLVATAISATAAADEFPTRPIRLVVGYAPGGPADVTARLLADRLSKRLGQAVVVENRGGAATIIAAQAVVRAPADGYTLFHCNNLMPTNQFFYSKLPYKVADFAPVSLIATMPYLVSIAASVPADSLKSFIDYVRTKPGQINYGIFGVGSGTHVLSKHLEKVANVKMVEVPYAGAAPAQTALLTGEIQLLIDTPVTALPQAKAGKTRVVAVMSEERLAAAPDVPTAKEQGFPLVFDNWYGVCAPAGTPKPIIARLSREIQAVTTSDDYKSRLLPIGVVPLSSTPEAFAREIEATIAKWGPISKPLNIRLD
jgi:tripartite-type tricarboxylate transporter receptor subunit TctC